MRMAIAGIAVFLRAWRWPRRSPRNRRGRRTIFFARAQAAYGAGDFNAAVEHLRRAEAAYEKIRAADKAKRAAVEQWLGNCYYQLQKPKERSTPFPQRLPCTRP